MKLLLLLLTGCSFAAAQDPYSTLPTHYKRVLDNKYVRISRITLSPGDKLPEHSHPSIPTVYVYTAPGGPIRFTHKTPVFTLQRPPVETGWVRFNRNAQLETHEMDYLGAEPTTYLRIELKTKPGPRHRDARLRDDKDFPWEDEQIRVTRLARPERRLAVPAVVVPLPSGEPIFVKAKSKPKIPKGSVRLIVVELKTQPIPAP